MPRVCVQQLAKGFCAAGEICPQAKTHNWTKEALQQGVTCPRVKQLGSCWLAYCDFCSNDNDTSDDDQEQGDATKTPRFQYDSRFDSGENQRLKKELQRCQALNDKLLVLLRTQEAKLASLVKSIPSNDLKTLPAAIEARNLNSWMLNELKPPSPKRASSDKTDGDVFSSQSAFDFARNFLTPTSKSDLKVPQTPQTPAESPIKNADYKPFKFLSPAEMKSQEGVAKYKQGSHLEAVTKYSEALGMIKGSEQQALKCRILYNRARAAFEMEDSMRYADILRDCQALLKINDKHFKSNKLIAQVKQEQGKNVEALKYWQKAVLLAVGETKFIEEANVYINNLKARIAREEEKQRTIDIEKRQRERQRQEETEKKARDKAARTEEARQLKEWEQTLRHKTVFELIDVKPYASDAEKKEAYRKALVRWHTDRAGGNRHVVEKLVKLKATIYGKPMGNGRNRAGHY